MEARSECHVVAMPYPGRGHINPMMNLCKLISARRPHTLFTFILTQEWYGFIRSDPTPENIRFLTVPDVIPSEIGRAKDFPGFYRATQTKLEAPVEELLDRLESPKPNVILHDTYLPWVVSLGIRKNIPVASFYTMSATVFSVFQHWDLLVQRGHTNNPNLSEVVNYLPGVAPIKVSDLPTPVFGKGKELIDDVLKAFSMVPKAQYLLFTSVYELEASAIDALRENLSIPVHPIGPAIPNFGTQEQLSQVIANEDQESDNVIKWLNAQAKSSVLYISQGSFLSVSSAQLDEIIAGVHESGVKYLWVAPGGGIDTSRFQRQNGDGGLVVPWCDQFKVLCHPSVGGFWSHCGWNSTKEAAFAGIPVLTFPIFWDQTTNSELIVGVWKIGVKVQKGDGSLVMRDEICGLLRRFMDLEDDDMKEMRRRAKMVQETCQNSVKKGGSSDLNIDAFINDIS
ncbi:unnamed protein product [Cuscuta epithymum]|uniref:Uncharacterized protein n=2 Tax=Cuscuta epithymum TaxID=186058 RepID=A0AAV0CGC6_9ASTE|nr:unnamed protein product [Cuscuta epithymum]